MDNTKVIVSNGSPYAVTANEKIFKAANMTSPKSVHHRKATFKFCSGSGPQILMNTHSIDTATIMQFLPPIQAKATLCSETGLPSYKTINPNANTYSAGRTIYSTMNKSFAIYANTKVTGRTTPESKLFEQQQSKFYMNNSYSYSYSQSENNRKISDKNAMEQQTEGYAIVNKIKSIVNFFMKPIIDTTTKIVGTDNNNAKPSTAQISTKQQQQQQNGSPMNQQNHKSTSMYCDNQSNDRFFSCSDKSNYYMNFMPETFFDCDDFIDGGEDTIDFVADSTSTQYNTFRNEFNESPIQPSPKDNIFYDCINKFGTEAMSEKVCDPDECETKLELVETSKSNIKSECKSGTKTDSNKTDNIVQYNNEASPMNCPKPEKSNKQSYQRKRKAKRKIKLSNRQHKSTTGSNKNHHEKIRHGVEMDIHDDIDDCSIVKDGFISSSYDQDEEEEPETDLEIIDVDEYQAPKSSDCCTSATASAASALTSNNIITKTSTSSAKKTAIDTKPCVEMPIPSPEVIPTGCIFTRFFRLDSPKKCKQKQQLLPLRCMQKQVPQQNKPLKERSTSCRRISETESDDSFIVFEDSSSPRSTTSVDDLKPKIAALKDSYKRQRQLSECSDDFIFFEEDNDDCSHRYDYTTDEDFTDSTDDSDNSDDDSDDESDCSDFSPVSNRKHDGENNQPDSGFEEKKVTFNLCPVVHEIRAWKFAYSEARKGKWEQMGRDRERFEKRINDVNRILAPILSAQHRRNIYEQRFREE